MLVQLKLLQGRAQVILLRLKLPVFLMVQLHLLYIVALNTIVQQVR